MSASIINTFTEKEILAAFEICKPSKNTKQCLRPAYEKSIYGKVIQFLTNRKSTRSEREELWKYWNERNKDKENISPSIRRNSDLLTKAPKHRKKRTKNAIKRKIAELEVQAEIEHHIELKARDKKHSKVIKKKPVQPGNAQQLINSKEINLSPESVPQNTHVNKKRKDISRSRPTGILKRLRNGLAKTTAKIVNVISGTSKLHDTTTIPIEDDTQCINNDSQSICANPCNVSISADNSDFIEDEYDSIFLNITCDANVSHLIEQYNAKISVYPSQVCTICKRIVYNNTNNVKQYTFTNKMIEILRGYGFQVFSIGETCKVCVRCNEILKRNKIPQMAFFNSMEIVPSRLLENLNDIEARLISQVKPFMKIFYLSKGQGQLALRGSCVHFPQSVEEIVDTLPLTKDAVDMLIINLTDNKSNTRNQFQVRPKLLYEALQYLKINNHLYKNIQINTDIDENDFQIHEVNPTINMQTKNVSDGMSFGYRKLDDNVFILRANLHESSPCFIEGNHSLVITLVAIAYSCVQPLISWSSTDFDNAFYAAEHYFKSIKLTSSQISLNNICKQITFFDSVTVNATILEESYSGFFNKVPGSQLTRLNQCIETFIHSNSVAAILHANGSYVGFVKSVQDIYMIDPFSRGQKGRKAEKGTACILRCLQDGAANFLSTIIHRNLQPSSSFNKQLAPNEKEKFSFCITFCSLEKYNNNDTSDKDTIHEATIVEQCGYIKLNETKSILRASFHQGTTTVFMNGGTQCAAMSASAAAHTLIMPVSDWNKNFLNQILIAGDRFYATLFNSRLVRENDFSPDSRYIEATELQGIIQCVRNAQVSCKVTTNCTWFGSLNTVPGNDVERLNNSIADFLNSDYNNAILTVNIFCMALLKNKGKLYIFDSHSRGPAGEQQENGTACVIELETDNAADEASAFVHRLCSPKEPYTSNANLAQQRFHTYTIYPILCSIVKAPDPNQPIHQSSTNTHNECETDGKNPSVTQDDSAFDIPTHNNPLMLDCVIRADEPDQPTVKSFIDACKNGEEIIPQINIKRTEGKPLNPAIEKRLEELAFIKCFPEGKNGCYEERKIPITPLDYFQQRIMSENKNFHTNEYLFYALSRVEAYTIHQKIAVCGNMAAINGDNNPETNFPGLDNIHLYMSSIRGSGSYWKKYTGDVLAMIEQLDVPTFFVSISYDDLNSLDSITALWKAKHGFNAELPCDPKDIAYEERKQLLNEHPVAAARHFNNRMNAIISLLKNNGEEIFGDRVKDFTYRVEFQGRGSPHVHMLLWLENQPNWETPEGLSYLERNITCTLNIPYRDLVIRCQKHSHRATCFKKHNLCRFGFPRKPCTEARILDEEEIQRCHGRFVEIRRSEEEIMINNYHPKLLQILQCNMDIQAVTGTRAIAYYVGKYMSKGEPTYLRQEIRDIINNFRADGHASYHRKALKIANAIIKHREISAQEAAFRLLHLRLRNSSRGFVFIPTYPPESRIRLIRRDTMFSDNPQTGLNIIDRYFFRPPELDHLCLLEFAAWWTPKANKYREALDADTEIGEDDLIEEEASERSKLKLLENKGYISKRKRHAIVKYPHFKPSEQIENYLYSMILLHKPMSQENFSGPYSNMREAFDDLKEDFRTHDDDPIINPNQAELISAVIEQLETGEERDGDREVGVNVDDESEEIGEVVCDEEDSALPIEIMITNHRNRILKLTAEQREVYNKINVQITEDLRNQEGEKLRIIVQGCGGTGKSYLISVLTELICFRCPNGKRSLIKAAPTGVASRNINGVTLHKAFSLGVEQHSVAQYMKLGGRLLYEKQLLFNGVQWLLIDEFSMISYQVLRQIHLRCTEIKGNEHPFGNMNIVLFGDMLQLSPCRGNWIFDQPWFLSHEQHLWRLFDFVELKTVKRQNDEVFLDILNRLRIGTLVRSDLSILRQRLLNPMLPNYEYMLEQSKHSLHLYPKVKQVDTYNKNRLQELQQTGTKLYTLRAIDTYASGMKFGQRIPDELAFSDSRKCAGISKDIILAVGCRVMLKWNMDPLGGLCNGSIGTVRKFNWTGLRRDQLQEGDLPESILVEFDGHVDQRHRCGVHGYENCTLVRPKTFDFPGKRGIRVHRFQIPLVICYACTIHKSQGLSLDYITLDLGAHIFSDGQAYVALSRCRTLEGVCITQIDEKKLLVSKTGKGPACTKPLRELTRLVLCNQLLSNGWNDINDEFIQSLIDWQLEYKFCNKCKEWVCECICNRVNFK